MEGVRIAARVLTDLERGPVLNAAGVNEVRIVASGGLDEYGVDRLVRAGAPIDVFAVRTRMGVAADAPYLDCAYKLVEYHGRPVMKLSSAKATAGDDPAAQLLAFGGQFPPLTRRLTVSALTRSKAAASPTR